MFRHMDDAAALALRTDRGEVGQLRLGVTAPALFVVYPEIAALFRARLPNVGLVVREMTTAEQEHALRRGDLDVGLVHPPLDDPGLATEEIGRAPFHIALPVAHPLTRHESVALGDLDGEQVVIFPREIAPQLYDTVLRSAAKPGSASRLRWRPTQRSRSSPWSPPAPESVSSPRRPSDSTVRGLPTVRFAEPGPN